MLSLWTVPHTLIKETLYIYLFRLVISSIICIQMLFHLCMTSCLMAHGETNWPFCYYKKRKVHLMRNKKKKPEDKNNWTWNNMRPGKQNQQINHGKQQKEHAQCDDHRLVIIPPAPFMSGVLSYKLHNALCSPLGIQRVLDHVRPRFLYWHRPRWPNADLTTCEVKPPSPSLPPFC